MINIEYDSRGELNIFVDKEGAEKLKKYLTYLIEEKDTHFHLMTPSWGGSDLDEEKIVEDLELINQVRLQLVED